MEEIAPRVFRIISRQLGVYPDQIALASSFYDDIGVDSLDVLEVVMALEDEFGLTIPDEAAGEVKTEVVPPSWTVWRLS
ncbi:acyl carrier protein (plasmid) [Sphingobium naphthae]|uniref:acyl carrier protein n=1 Tax=Sphingobium naphthae TaxID=1886786 RepID=UPI00374784F8